MNINITKEEREVIGAVKYMPAVSIILPFDPKMIPQSILEYNLKMALSKAEKQLNAAYPDNIAKPVITKLYKLIDTLNYTTHKKSVAIFASPIIEKAFYLDIPVMEKIVIDESFEIRDLVYCKKQSNKYLLLTLSGTVSKMFLVNNSSFTLIKSNKVQEEGDEDNTRKERVGHFADPDKYKEIGIIKFLHQMDAGLSLIINAYGLPLFVLGPEKIVGHFKKITNNEKNILEYVHGNFDEATEKEIRATIAPYVEDWQKVKTNDLLRQMKNAQDAKKLSIGIEDVWDTATHKNSRLLIVEKDFVFPARHGDRPDKIYSAGDITNHPFYIKDAVDDVMEKVLENGGDVEFVGNGTLNDYGHIALIQYYKN
jgi:Bacterial archaeo-eukaryotic release factor family 3